MTTAPTNANPQIARWALITVMILILFVAVWLVHDILMLTLTAVIFAVILTTPIHFFVRHGIRRPIAVLLTLVLIVVVIIAAALLLLPDLLGQFRSLIVVYIPTAADQVRHQLQPENLIQHFPFLEGIDLKNITDQISNQFLGGLANLTTQLVPFVGSLASVVLSILIVLFLGLYFIADPTMHANGLLQLFPIGYRPRANEILIALDKTLRKFLQAQLLLMVIIGISEGLALWLIGLPLAGVLGTITGLLSFVPNFGPLVALVPILAVAIINTPDKVLLVIAVFYILQFLQSQLLTPLLLGQEINLPPAVILLSQIVAGIFFGFLGLLLSVPLAAILIVLVREIYIKDILGDKGVSERDNASELDTEGV